MHLELARDLFLRYTQPGQTVLDPFGGIGTSLIGAALPEPRHVILHELEPPFVELARGNWDKIKSRTLPGMPLGDVTILQGDSRHLPLPDAECDSAVSSPPFLDARSGTTYERPHASVYGGNAGGLVPQSGGASPWGTTPGNIYNMKPGDVDAAVSSPPYGDVASRNRSEEPHSLHSPYAESHGKAAPNRHVDGYGRSSGQIGALSHAAVDHGCVSSPPFADSLLTTADTKRDWVRANGKPQGLGGSTFEDYGHSDGQIGAQDGETYAAACLACYREAFRVVRPGGVLVLVTGDYIRAGVRVDLAEDTIQLAVAAGWAPVERWKHAKAQVSFWRRLHAKRNPEAPTVTSEDVLVFVKEYQGWPFVELPPTTLPPASLVPAFAGAEIPVMLELDLAG